MASTNLGASIKIRALRNELLVSVWAGAVTDSVEHGKSSGFRATPELCQTAFVHRMSSIGIKFN